MKTDKLAINSVSTTFTNLPEILKAYSDAGFVNVEFCFPHAKGWLAEEGRSAGDLKKLLDDHGLRCIGGFEAGFTAFGPKAERKKANKVHLENAALLAELGGGVIVVGTDGPKQHEVEALDTIGQGLADLADQVDDSVAFAVEFNWSPIVKSIRAAKRVVDAADHKRVGILFDPAHYHCTPSKAEDLTKSVVKKILHIHVDDMQDKPGELSDCNADRVLPGEGIIDLEKLLGRIRDHGYKGYFSIEMFTQSLYDLPAEQAAKKCYKAMRKLAKKL